LFTGVPPIPANATNTIALWTAAAASGGAYRKRLDIPRRVMIRWLTVSLIGGLAGALLLLKTPAHTFMASAALADYGATILYAFGKKLAGGRGSVLEHETGELHWLLPTLFPAGGRCLCGYFGGGWDVMWPCWPAGMDIHAMTR